MSAIHNERVKLAATALNNVGVATIVTGLVVPAASFFYGFANVPSGHLWWLVALAWFGTGFVLHWLARTILGGLRP